MAGRRIWALAERGTIDDGELGLAFLPWSPLGGLGDAKDLADNDPAFAQVAEARGVSGQQVALAW